MILKKHFLKIVLIVSLICVIFCTPVFAASEDSPLSSEVPSDVELLSNLVLPEEYKDPVYQYFASGDGVKAVTYTTTDIYNLLSIALYNEGTTNTWSLPRIAYWTHLTKNNTDSIHQDLREIHMILDGSYSGTYVRPSIQEMLFTSDGQGNFTSIAQAISDFPSLTYSAVNQLLGAQQNCNYYLSQILSKFSGDFTWTAYPASFVGVTRDRSNNYLSSYTNGSSFNTVYSFSGSLNPSLIRISIPLDRQTFSYSFAENMRLNSIAATTDFSTFYDLGVPDYFFELSTNKLYLYIFDFKPFANWNYLFNVSNANSYMYFIPGLTNSIEYMPFDTDSYQQVKQAFYAQKTARAQGSMADDVKHLADYLADPDKIAAEQASQAVIDDTLDGFTGNGAAAAKTSDTGSMKNMSSSLQSGLDTGASAGNAASVFTDNRYWGWFTQQNADLINNPYPAPTYQSTRASGDQIRDAYSHNQSDLEDMLRGSSW